MSEPKQHALYAASSSDRWGNCHGSLKRIAKAPSQKSGAAADEGTLAHSVMEEALIKNISAEEAAMNLEFELDVQIPEEMIDHVQGFVDYVHSQMKPHYELLVEEKVYLDMIHPTEAFGTVDVAIIEPFGLLHIIDFKYGQGFVNHKDNSQMIYYALGIAHTHHYDFDEVKTTIYQPRAGSTDKARTDSFSVEKLKTWRDRFKSWVEACEVATEDDVHAGSWCKFCPAKITCPALTRSNFEVAKLDFGDVVQPAPKSLTSDQLKTILDRSAYLELWIKEVKKYAEDQIRSGKKIAGWGLVPTKPQRKWVEPISIQLGYPELVKKEVVSPAEAEKILKKKWDKKTVENFFEEHVVVVSSGDKISQTTNDYGDEGLDDLITDYKE